MPSSLVDVVWLVLFAMLTASPQFLDYIRLPFITTSDSQKSSTSQVSPESVTVDLLRDGSLRLQGREVSREELVTALCATELAARAISLRIDAPDGQGPLTQLLQLQQAFAAAKLTSRVTVAVNPNSHQLSAIDEDAS